MSCIFGSHSRERETFHSTTTTRHLTHLLTLLVSISFPFSHFIRCTTWMVRDTPCFFISYLLLLCFNFPSRSHSHSLDSTKRNWIRTQCIVCSYYNFIHYFFIAIEIIHAMMSKSNCYSIFTVENIEHLLNWESKFIEQNIACNIINTQSENFNTEIIRLVIKNKRKRSRKLSKRIHISVRFLFFSFFKFFGLEFERFQDRLPKEIPTTILWSDVYVCGFSHYLCIFLLCTRAALHSLSLSLSRCMYSFFFFQSSRTLQSQK